MVKKFIGKRVKIKASFVCIDDKLASPKALLHNVSIDGQWFRSHIWIDVAMLPIIRTAKSGDVIDGTARLCEYLGLDGDKVVKKIGVKHLKIRSIK